MKRLTQVFVAALALVAGLILPVPTVLASYGHPCTVPSSDVSQTAVVRGADLGFSGTDITGAIADITARNVIGCTSPSGSAWDDPAILPVNLQQSSTGGIVQLGWIRCVTPGFACGNVPADGSAHFVYICDDLSGGLPCDAGSWAGTPLWGHRYRFRVQYNQTGTG